MPDPLVRPVDTLRAIAAHYPDAPSIDELTIGEYLDVLSIFATLCEKQESWLALIDEIENRMEQAADAVEDVDEQ